MSVFDFFKKNNITTARGLAEASSHFFFVTPHEFSPKNYELFAKEAYIGNVIAHRCISERAGAIGSLNWRVFRNGEIVDDMNHPLVRLLRRPNPMQGHSAFFSQIEYFLLLSGNNYMIPSGSAAINPDGSSRPPRELYNLRPDKVKVEKEQGSSSFFPNRYVYSPLGVGNSKDRKIFPVNQVTGQSDILHFMYFDPLSSISGRSPIESAAFSIDTHSESIKWNFSLLHNGARPSLVISVDGSVTKEKMDMVREAIEKSHQGSNNAGKPMVVGGNTTVTPFGMTPKQMDFVETKNSVAKDICTAFRVPPILVNIGGDATFSNMKEARLSLWEDTVLPEADYIRDELNNWLTPKFGEDFSVGYDLNEVDALVDRRRDVMVQLSSVDFLSVNEKRKMVGFDEVDGGDVVPDINATEE